MGCGVRLRMGWGGWLPERAVLRKGVRGGGALMVALGLLVGAAFELAFAADLVATPYTKAPAYDPPLYGWIGSSVGIEDSYDWGPSIQTDPWLPTPSPFPTPSPTPSPTPTPT